MNERKPAAGGKKKRAGKLLIGKKINFASVGQKKSRTPQTILVFVLAAAGIAAFSKFLVLDRLNSVAVEQAKANALEAQLEGIQAQITELESLPEQYYHYTLTGMTEEELTRVARAEVSDLILKIADQVISMDSFRLTGNNLSISVTAEALGDITRLVGDLQQDPLVETISLTTAQSDEQEGRVRVNDDGEEVEQPEVSNIKAQLSLFLTADKEQEDTK